MADETTPAATISLSKVGTFIGAVVGILAICSAISVFFILPYRVAAAEVKIMALEVAAARDREMAIRMEERLWTVQNALGIKAEPPKK
jgi:hypothetical protein